MTSPLVFLLRRREDLTYEQFARYWREVHAPLVAERAPVLGIDRYEQWDVTEGVVAGALAAARSSPAPYDGIAVLWTSRPAVQDAEATARAAQELLDDERRFLDLASSPLATYLRRRIV